MPGSDDAARRRVTATVASIAGVIRQHPVGAFLVWFFTVGQAIAFIPLLARWTTGAVVPTEPFLLAATAVGLVLPTVSITWITDGTAGVKALRRRAVSLWFPVRWYAFAVIGVPVTLVAIWATVAGPPEQVGGSGAAMAFSAWYVLQLVVVFVTFNLWEELAWMGFVQARLQDGHGAIRAAVLTGPIFALGHISQVIEGSVATTLVTLTVLVAVCIPFRALQALVYNRTGSLVPVALVHAAANSTAAGSLVGAGLLDRLYPGDGAGGLVFPVLGALGLIAIVMTRGRLGRQSPARQVEHPEPVLTQGDQG
jgi:membrane protease YdiL (CAAX protease family)